MKSILTTLFSALLGLLVKYFGQILNLLDKFLQVKKLKLEQDDRKIKVELEKKIDDVVDNGNLEDLMGLRK